MGNQFLFARWGTRFADRLYGSGYNDPEPGTWRFLLPPEKGNSGRMILSAELLGGEGGKKERVRLSPYPASPCLSWNLACPPLIPAPDLAADLSI